MCCTVIFCAGLLAVVLIYFSHVLNKISCYTVLVESGCDALQYHLKPLPLPAQVERRDAVPPPRAVRTHLPYRFVQRWIEEDNVKTIMVTRNPKDTAVSNFHFNQDLKRMLVNCYQIT